MSNGTLKKTINRSQYGNDRYLEFSDKDFKAATIKMLQQTIINMLETKAGSISKESSLLRKEAGDIRKIKKTILTLNTIIKLKNSVYGLTAKWRG